MRLKFERKECRGDGKKGSFYVHLATPAAAPAILLALEVKNAIVILNP